ncbi:hypothetical protein M8J77_003162 [Diaphorina citri]|nr:hypothetical protein M8J77_003162 [Diaphorina citri]
MNNNNILPSGEKSIESPTLSIELANRHHAGLYKCTASNGVGTPASSEINVKVLFPPEIELERAWVHSGEGYEAQLVCIVDAQPAAEASVLSIEHPITEVSRLRLYGQRFAQLDFETG